MANVTKTMVFLQMNFAHLLVCLECPQLTHSAYHQIV